MHSSTWADRRPALSRSLKSSRESSAEPNHAKPSQAKSGQARPGSHDSSAPGIITASASGRHTFLAGVDPPARLPATRAASHRRLALRARALCVCERAFSLSLFLPFSLTRAAFRPVVSSRPDGTISANRSHGTRSREMRRSCSAAAPHRHHHRRTTITTTITIATTRRAPVKQRGIEASRAINPSALY